MRLDINISPEIYIATKAEAHRTGLTQSAIIRRRLNEVYRLTDDFKPQPRTRFFSSHQEEE